MSVPLTQCDVPEGRLVYKSQVETIEPSQVRFLDYMGTVESGDKSLRDSAELYRFLITHSRPKPKLTAKIKGFSEYVLEDSFDHQIVDTFEFELDLSSLISDEWVYCCAQAGWRQSLDEYVKSRRPLKEILMKKEVSDLHLEQLKGIIETKIRGLGFSEQLEINVRLTDANVRVFSSSPLSKFANNPCVGFLCCITCLCIVFAPIYYSSVKSFGDIFAQYEMVTTPLQFVERNMGTIMDIVRRGLDARALGKPMPKQAIVSAI